MEMQRVRRGTVVRWTEVSRRPISRKERAMARLRSQIVTSSSAIPAERIERHILLIRGHKVMLDADLAELYGVETKALNRAVRRNFSRFPKHFMFQLTAQERENLRCQFGTSSSRVPALSTGT